MWRLCLLNNRQRMRASNKMVREWLLRENYDEIWFKPHTARNDLVFSKSGNYLATDLWNLFDGMCFSPNGLLYFLQMKTNGWAKEKPIKKFCERHPNSKVLVFNVTNKLVGCNGKYQVRIRSYRS